jgi:uncharacterized protein YjiS (DUF1127 family)
MFIVLPSLYQVSRVVAGAWRRYRRGVVARREFESLNDNALRDLGLSHRSAIKIKIVDSLRSSSGESTSS